MTQQLTPFNFEGAHVRVVSVGGEPWFVAKDVAVLLGYANPQKAVRDHCKAARPAGVSDSFTLDPQTSLIPERDLYRLVMKSHMAAAERFEEWVVAEVLPSIRKTGGYQRPMTQLEIIAANAAALVDQERRISATEQVVADLSSQLERVAESRVWDHCPQNCEPITKIRTRMQARYGIPAWVVDTVMRELPLSPKVHAMIRNAHESAAGSQYEVWAVADVTRTFKRFVDDCQRVTACFVTHPDINRQFRMNQLEVAA